MTANPHDSSRESGPSLAREEQLLASHLSARLDGHLGGARKRFEAILEAETAAPRPVRPSDGHRGRWGWHWGLGLFAAAACVLVVVSLLVTLRGRPQGGSSIAAGPDSQQPLGVSNLTPLEYSESWNSADLGVYEFGGQPVRAVHQQQWERARYQDAGYEVQIDVPCSNLVLYDAPIQ